MNHAGKAKKSHAPKQYTESPDRGKESQLKSEEEEDESSPSLYLSLPEERREGYSDPAFDATKPVLILPNDDEKKETPSKKAQRKRKADVSGASTDGRDTAVKKSKKDKMVEDFVLVQLPALKRSMIHQKKQQSSFRIRDYSEYFSPSSGFTPTFLLPLFHFLAKEEITCTRYGQFDQRHMVKTDDGFKHVSFLLSHCTLSEEEGDFLMKKFGKEWYKIPAKDQSRVSVCSRDGERGEFKIELVGIYEGSFRDQEGNIVNTINPMLRYYPVKHPNVVLATTPTPKEKKKKEKHQPIQSND